MNVLGGEKMKHKYFNILLIVAVITSGCSNTVKQEMAVKPFEVKETKYAKDLTTQILVDHENFKQDNIVKVIKHGDHYHVFTKDGQEYISYKDPRSSDYDTYSNEIITVISSEELNGKVIIESFKHGDHWHVKTADGKEYVVYSDPNGKSNINQIISISSNNDTRVVSKIVKHGDHYHVTINGVEEIMYEKDLAKLKQSIKKLPPIEIAKDDSIIDAEHDDIHVNMHFHGTNKYLAGEELRLYAHSSVAGIKTYRWLIKKQGAKNFDIIEGKQENTLSMPVDLTYNQAKIKAQALDKNAKVLDTATLTISVKKEIDTNSESAKHILINDLGINEKIAALFESEYKFKTAGNIKFPFDTSDKNELLQFLNQVIYLNLEGIENPKNDNIFKYIRNIQGLSFSDNISAVELKDLIDNNQYLKTNLSYLSLNKTAIENLDFINQLRHLQQLELDGLDKQAINFDRIDVEKLSQIWKLYITDVDLEDISFLSKFPALQKLKLSKTNIHDIGAIANLGELKELTLANNKIDDLSNLRNCSKLTKLTLDGTTTTSGKQVDISFVNDTNIDTLLMKKCKLTDLSALSGNDKLRQLDASDSDYQLTANGLPDSLPKLEGLNISGGYFTSLNDLPIYPNLKQLALDRSGLSDLNGIQKQKQLEIASFVGNMISTFMIDEPAPSVLGLMLTNNNLKSWEGFKVNFPNALDGTIVVKNPISGTTPE